MRASAEPPMKSRRWDGSKARLGTEEPQSSRVRSPAGLGRPALSRLDASVVIEAPPQTEAAVEIEPLNSAALQSPDAPSNPSHLRLFIGGSALALITLLVYCPSFDHDFVNIDDNAYIQENRQVQAGLTPDGVAWAFTTFEAANWHPLTWISLELDSTLFGGQKAFGFHLTNVLLHTANTVILFVVLTAMTGLAWRSGVVAALFALHPLHVESVAWVTERKDVLSTLFWLLTTAAYLGYVRRPGVLRYLAMLLCLALGLLAKPMLVTLPCVLLPARLLAAWPYSPRQRGRSRRLATPCCWRRLRFSGWWRYRGVFTYLAQSRGHAVMSFERFPLSVRLWNVLLAYVEYIAKALWPTRLAIYYPHPARACPSDGTGRRALAPDPHRVRAFPGSAAPYLPVGWFWYLGTLVPVIGLVQVGDQALADRYTYVPFIGLFLLVTWGTAEMAQAWHVPRVVVSAVATGLLLVCTGLTWRQLTHWENGLELWKQAASVSDQSSFAHYYLPCRWLSAACARTD